MTGEVLRVAADLVVIAALLAATLTTIGMWRMTDLYNQIHAAGGLPYLTLLPLAVAQAVHWDAFLLARALLVLVFLLVTTAVSSHVIGLAAYRRDRDDGSSGSRAVDAG